MEEGEEGEMAWCFFLAHSWKFRAWTVPPSPAESAALAAGR